jgi:hypothetical protein
VLLDGRVLVAGSDHAALLYDPSTGTWSRTGNNSSGAVANGFHAINLRYPNDLMIKPQVL